LFDKSQEDSWDHDLADSEGDWVMKTENNKTSLLMRDPYPATRGPAECFIRAGSFLTLAELFYYKGRKDIIQLYKIWLTLPVWIYKKEHRRSHSARATFRRKAKQLQYLETGRWGLPPR
jgi:hypothetical protein